MNKRVFLTVLIITLASLFISTRASSVNEENKANNAKPQGKAMLLTKLTLYQQGRGLTVKEVLVTFDDFTQRLIVYYPVPAASVSVKVANINTRQIVYSNIRPVNQMDQEIIDLNGVGEGQYELTFSYPDFTIVGGFEL